MMFMVGIQELRNIMIGYCCVCFFLFFLSEADGMEVRCLSPLNISILTASLNSGSSVHNGPIKYYIY
jgi:hypothetical protein